MVFNLPPIALITIYVIYMFCFFLAILHGMQDVVLVPKPGITHVLSKVEAWSFNHWTIKEVPLTASCTAHEDKNDNVNNKLSKIVDNIFSMLLYIRPCMSC